MNLTNTNQNLPSVEEGGAWGSEGTFREHIVIPRLQLMQASSKFVKAKKNQDGDIIESINGEVLGRLNEPMFMIPFKTFGTIQVFEGHGNKKKYLKTIPMDDNNVGIPWEYTLNGQPVTNVKIINFFCIVPGHTDGLPFLIGFKGSSFNTGKKLSSFFQNCEMKGITPAKSVFQLSSESKTKDDNTFSVYDLKYMRPSTTEELALAKKWYLSLTHNSDSVKVDEEPEAKSDAESF